MDRMLMKNCHTILSTAETLHHATVHIEEETLQKKLWRHRTPLVAGKPTARRGTERFVHTGKERPDWWSSEACGVFQSDRRNNSCLSTQRAHESTALGRNIALNVVVGVSRKTQTDQKKETAQRSNLWFLRQVVGTDRSKGADAAPHRTGEIGKGGRNDVESPKHAVQCSAAMQFQDPNEKFPRNPEEESNDEVPGGPEDPRQTTWERRMARRRSSDIRLEVLEDQDHPSLRTGSASITVTHCELHPYPAMETAHALQEEHAGHSTWKRLRKSSQAGSRATLWWQPQRRAQNGTYLPGQDRWRGPAVPETKTSTASQCDVMWKKTRTKAHQKTKDSNHWNDSTNNAEWGSLVSIKKTRTTARADSASQRNSIQFEVLNF